MWNICSTKSEFEKLTIPFLSHEVSAGGIRALLKIVKGIEDLPFPSTYKRVQSFLGSVNYYNKFIEDLPVVAAVLDELDEERVRNLEAAKKSFEILKRTIVSTPLLRHSDKAKPFVTIPHANPWAACAVLSQEHEGLIHPVGFTGRVLKESELRYHIAEKEKDEDGLVAILERSGITSRKHLDKAAETLTPAKGRLNVMPPVSLEMLDANYEGYVLSFNGAAKVTTRVGDIVGAARMAGRHILEGVTANDAEYHGLILGLKLALQFDVKELVAVGDSRIVVQQAQRLINCNQPTMQRRLAEYEDLRKDFASVKLIRVKREFNQAANYLTSKTLVLGESWELNYPDEIVYLRLVSRIPEKIMKPSEIPDTSATDAVRTDQVELGRRNPDLGIPETLAAAAEALMVMTRTRAGVDKESRSSVDRSGYQDERWRKIKVHHDEDPWIQQMKKVLKGDVSDLSRKQVKKIAKVSDPFVLDSREILYRLSAPTPDRPRNKQSELRLVVPESLRADMLHYSHEDFRGGHQGINPTFERLRSEFYWVGVYADVQKFARECVDCASAKGRPPVAGPSPGNQSIRLRWSLLILSLSYLSPIDQFPGYVMCKPVRNAEVQDVAEAYEECVLRRFGASSMIRHDQDPRFMSKVFARFRDLLKSKQRATLGYRPQANGQQERSVQTVMRSVRAYVAEVDQSDWDEHAQRLMFALNTLFDTASLDTPFYLGHGRNDQGTISAMLGPKPSTARNEQPWNGVVKRYGIIAMHWHALKTCKRKRNA
ncbi:LOW QUALITY PROTEIN: reverse transcriptase [Phytophthora megakarya]|uniref:Reverse transcriptase n=1 Tax=Phytophthora megakarya TaxID=4795 RepID=A0A225W8W0_9STRA|nr:LOW QUALITY PROTEIN: reverse transcriptase [Phytophthora megakarya]